MLAAEVDNTACIAQAARLLMIWNMNIQRMVFCKIKRAKVAICPFLRCTQSAQRWVGLAFGDAHGAGVTAGGRVFTWGGNAARQLGQDPPEPADQPAELAVLRGLDVKLLACGAQVSIKAQ